MWKQLRRKIWEGRGIWTIAPGVTGVILALRLFGWLQPWEWATFDQYFRWRPLEPTDERLVIVGINEADIKQIGQWPLPDDVLAQLIEKIKAQNPKAIGLDLYRDLPVQPGSSALVNVFETTPNLIGIEKIQEQDPSASVPPPPVLNQLDQVGFNNQVVDVDGKLRRALLYMTKNEQPTISFSLRLALIYLQDYNIYPQPSENNSAIFNLGKGTLRPFTFNDGGYINGDDGGYQILLNYRSPAGSFRRVSLTEVLANRIPKDLMRDRIVLIGATATSLNDFFYTPYSGNEIATQERTPGVEVQANIISHLLSSALDGRPGIKTWSEPIEGLWIFLWSFTGATLCWVLRDAEGVAKLLPRWTVISLVLALSGLVGSSYLAFLIGGWWIPVIPSALALLGAATATTGYIANVEREERQTVMNLFSRHVTQQIAETIWRDRHQLLKEGRLRGRKMTATVLFSDLKGFSTVAEHMEPETVMVWLNEYMDAMAGLVLQHGGVVDKFIGDAVMAVFGVPIERNTSEEIAQDAIAAVHCAIAMAQKLETLNQQWHIQGYPQTAMRVGIATGNVVTGSLGSSQRFDYTTLGDSVNVAARLESYDKSLDGGICRILINEETYQRLQNSFPTKAIGQTRLKGRDQLTVVYQILY
ncbi:MULTISPECIES: CHASE2 domain-containing protein [unclassified Coleofasciculus]|uniref:CHASE2 domain-containing protein n=1 Tax=unclassified Coleofasciculus TaxID=2692782 RepID=UPI00187F3235|nr:MULTISPECIES: adenylate/guanylate cyclase domain-containing protein [unclassified Coleofasciculus]MBE9129075.1 adenylate/guanylate cyclase domain-containing protein [Coleofasciculus sp. LEGE 07081]MBE9151884.1 adenylate/guanylate cyclase domain-containing protein [Coleofasciculus sp. LEGE 07092]